MPGTLASLSYSLEGGTTGSRVEIDYNEPNTGSCDWVIPPGLFSLSCRVRAIIYDGSYWSAAVFNTAASTMTHVGGNWTVDDETDITLISGTVIFDGYESSSLKNYDSGTAFFNQLMIDPIHSLHNSIALHWSCPVWYSHFNIYRDMVPDFVPGPGNLHFQAGNTNYAEPATVPFYFYKITAVREAVVAGERIEYEVSEPVDK